MIPHEFLDDELRDRATEYALGSLSEAEAREVRLHLSSCRVCRREVDEVSSVMQRIVLAGPTRTPRPELWSRLRDRLGAPSKADRGMADREKAEGSTPVARALLRERAADTAEFAFVPSDEPGWLATGVGGVEVRRLSIDRENDRLTFLARMAPGAAYPPHRHGGPEECYVLQGDLDVGDRRMRAGDYQRAERGSVHPAQSTREGCLLLIVSSLSDEMVA